MSIAERIESNLLTLCHDIQQVFKSEIVNSEALDEAIDASSTPENREMLNMVRSCQPGELRPVIEGCALSEVLWVCVTGMRMDGHVASDEIRFVETILRNSFYRLAWNEHYRDLATPQLGYDVIGVIKRWESDKSYFGGKTDNRNLCCWTYLACCLNKSSALFSQYKQVMLLTARGMLLLGLQAERNCRWFEILVKSLTKTESLLISHFPETAQSSKSQSVSKTAGSIPEPLTPSITPDQALNEGLAELNQLIGIEAVKAEVRRLANFLKVRKQRLSQGLTAADKSLHFVFIGNPGTGKTTVARCLAKILYGLGALPKSNFVEVDRSGMVEGYVGQTAIRTKKVIAKATGGVLFIDEAYALVKAGSNDFGQEAIDTLLKGMEDLRDQLVVIVAGYPDQMEVFLGSNPGLQSRFTQYIKFPDYDLGELCLIFEGMCSANYYLMTAEALGNLALMFRLAHWKRPSNFGNARFVRNIFEAALGHQADRLSALDREPSRKELMTIAAVDLPYDMVEGSQQIVDLTESRWRASCPKCKHDYLVGLRLIGRRVLCRKCQQSFQCPWWQPELATIPGMSVVVDGEMTKIS